MQDNLYRTDLVDLDDHEVREFLEIIGRKDLEKIFRVQIKKSARILQNETISRFMAKYNYKGAWKQEIRRKSGKTKIKTRKVAKVTSKKKGGESLVKVHIMDDYRVKWLEMGTKKRYTKGHLNIGYYRLRRDAKWRYILRAGKPGYRGMITAGSFFQEAQERKESTMIESINKNIGNAIQKELKNMKK